MFVVVVGRTWIVGLGDQTKFVVYVRRELT